MISLKSSLVIVALLSLAARASIGPRDSLSISNAIISPDGFPRSSVLAGGAFPGPVISGTKGDNFQLNVVNRLTDITMEKTTTIHWHGLFQEGTAWADGPAFVTQCPIASGNSFLYNFDVPEQAGTFWYHSHLTSQYCDGLRGAFVVYDPNDPHRRLYDVDDDSTIITLADWYHVVGPQTELLSRQIPNATLINGRGRYPGGAAVPLAVIDVVQGKRYRFRLVSISCSPDYAFSIDGHTMTVIEADGENITPLVVDSIRIFAGQRYSFVLNADKAVNNYWVRANPNIGPRGFDGNINSAILRYSGAAITPPTTSAHIPTLPLLETNLHPLTSPAAPGKPGVGLADVNINLAMAFDPSSERFTINGVSYVSPTVPVLLQILSGTTNAGEADYLLLSLGSNDEKLMLKCDIGDLLPSGSIYLLPRNKVIEISIPGITSSHPFHLHGHAFSVIRSAGSTAYNFVNPVRRDVVNVGVTGDNVTIRFVTDNPGPWFLHCHIDWHLVKGLTVVMVEDAPGVAVANEPIPSEWIDLCPIYDSLTDIEKGAIV